MAVTSNRLTRVAVTLAIVALVASGCGSGAHTNGLETKSATQVGQAAAAALKTARSVHLTGTGRGEGNTVRLDLRIQGKASTGTIGQAPGAQYEITATDTDVYVKAALLRWLIVGHADRRFALSELVRGSGLGRRTRRGPVRPSDDR
jgi:hypothetical protein